MSDEKIKLWFEVQAPGEKTKTMGIQIDPGASAAQIREAFRVAADAAMQSIRPMSKP